MNLCHIDLTETGIVLLASDESRVELAGRDVWKLLMWMNWHIIELGQRKEMEGVPNAPLGVQEPPPTQQS